MEMRGLHYDLDSLFPNEPDFLEEEELCLKDYEYLKRLYPKEIRLISSILEEYLDRYEYEGSPMYAQYPDAVTVYRIAGEINDKFTFEGSEKERTKMKELIQVMVCQEMYIRRRRHDKFCRRFNHCQMR
ncbi:MAG: hypothetical protein NC300_10780 [Bacteroidales bacterium]|nr:hypothetical protein [Clostridium sp.]MCM1204615.1 hypothetical protein [Bacteroidales bacterium]